MMHEVCIPCLSSILLAVPGRKKGSPIKLTSLIQFYLFFQTITAFMPKFDKYNDNIDIHLTTEQPSFLTKFIIDIKTQKATEERLLNLVVERPSYNSGVLARTITYLR